jgi:hypothetical protein
VRARALLAILLLVAAPAAARPTYFDALMLEFGFGPGDRLYACGVCHFLWTGTGARNVFGTSVEQELYLGKPIAQAIDDAVARDPDGDGFTSFAELATHQTLPGYSCTDYFLASGAPPDWHAYVTPLVASCLEPKDVRIAPASAAFGTDAGDVETSAVTVFNNGSAEPITITSYAFLAGASPALSVDGPTAPFVLAVGETAELVITFAPEGVVASNTALRIASDDPDEPAIDFPVSAFGVVRPLAPAEPRAACLRDVERALARYAKIERREWLRCQGAEAAGKACDLGRRDLALLRAEAALRDALGGARDKRCGSAGLSPALLGLPEACGGGCATTLATFGDLATCLVCRERAATDALLEAAVGAAPPDLPPRAGSRVAERCQSGLLADASRAAGKAQTLLGRCALGNVTAAEPADCAAANGDALGALVAKVAGRFARCRDTAGLAGCFAPGDDATCVGESAVSGAASLIDAAFGLD